MQVFTHSNCWLISHKYYFNEKPPWTLLLLESRGRVNLRTICICGSQLSPGRISSMHRKISLPFHLKCTAQLLRPCHVGVRRDLLGLTIHFIQQAACAFDVAHHESIAVSVPAIQRWERSMKRLRASLGTSSIAFYRTKMMDVRCNGGSINRVLTLPQILIFWLALQRHCLSVFTRNTPWRDFTADKNDRRSQVYISQHIGHKTSGAHNLRCYKRHCHDFTNNNKNSQLDSRLGFCRKQEITLI